jgi:hypothetical protein
LARSRKEPRQEIMARAIFTAGMLRTTQYRRKLADNCLSCPWLWRDQAADPACLFATDQTVWLVA